ncbi:protein -v, chloroplastic [Sesamum alatum]|uniref:Protein TIC 20 n=1 Tax=Sesamum alatum TaxID=300844 RepID=A0AAE2CZ25_9LAMI|nr:protein -v, chloroplastic [Sesamum alatum]
MPSPKPPLPISVAATAISACTLSRVKGPTIPLPRISEFCDSAIYNTLLPYPQIQFNNTSFLGHPSLLTVSQGMAINSLLSFPSTLPNKQSPFSFSSLNPKLTHSQSSASIPHFPTLPPRNLTRRTLIIAQSKDSNSADAPDRLISAITYFYPFFDGIQYGKYVITQFSPFQAFIQPLVPAIRVFKSFPFNGFLVFLTLYFVVVRNPNFSRYVRFNTMQAIVLDVLLIFPDLLERTFNPRDGVGLDLMMSLDSTVFLFLLVCLVYGSSSCLLGQLPRLPLVAEAADRQVM